jgi:hypothetical protein
MLRPNVAYLGQRRRYPRGLLLSKSLKKMFNAIARPSPPKHARGLAQNIFFDGAERQVGLPSRLACHRRNAAKALFFAKDTLTENSCRDEGTRSIGVGPQPDHISGVIAQKWASMIYVDLSYNSLEGWINLVSRL